ncbi:MAG: PilZ domain-containing protein [Deltaproteobacteria bacterium]|nr:PilZ domain-containing protein [Deltaproteobacteria bacterium]
MSAEDRQHPRAHAKIRVEFHFGATVGVGHTNDVSEGGLFLETTTLADPGTRIYMRMYLPGAPAESSLKVIGIVRRRIDATEEDHGPGMGIRFEVAYRRAREILGGFMRGLIEAPDAVHDIPQGDGPVPPAAPSLRGVEAPPSNGASLWLWAFGVAMVTLALLRLFG